LISDSFDSCDAEHLQRAKYQEDRDTTTEGVFLRLYSEMQADEVPDHLSVDPAGAGRREEDPQQEVADSLPLLNAGF
jgi:hypothetical protein